MRISLKDWLRQRREPWTKVFYTAFRRWRADRMERVRMRFDRIGLDSVIFDVGGFQGNWAFDIHERYGSQVHVFEPHPVFVQEIRDRFQDNPAITIHDFALGHDEGSLTLSDDGDASSSFHSAKNIVTGRIKAEPRAVSLHVRRGDYVSNSKVTERHGICTPDYYTQALAHVAQKMEGDPIIYAFSDDPEWVRGNLKLPAEIRIVGHNDSSKNIEDLRLMSACRHHIIANSSFSWWAAWLNPRADKIVAAPARWFADPAYANPDILADGWAAIEG